MPPRQTKSQLSLRFGCSPVSRSIFAAPTTVCTTSSFAVETKISRSKTLVPKYNVDGTPTVVVNGKYRVTGASAGGYEKLFDVVNFLVAKESAGKPAAK